MFECLIYMKQTACRCVRVKTLDRFFKIMFRYINYALSLNNSIIFHLINFIFNKQFDLTELDVKDATDKARYVSHLFDKRDNFNFLIVNFPFVCSPAVLAYGVYISQLIRYSIACGSYKDFLDRELLLTRKLLNHHGFPLTKLKSSLRKFYARHHNLVNRYGTSVLQMTTYMFHLS